MSQQLYHKKGNKYYPVSNELSQYEEDCIWMSARYCIGRHTIASHMHAGEIASHAYGRMSDERSQFMSEDINREIANILHIHDWVTFEREYNAPISDFRPLDLLYRFMDANCITSDDELRKIKNITATYDDGWIYDIYRFHEGRSNVRSLSDIQDLEVWQQLANLFDLEGHKTCRLTDGTLCEYYECWKSCYENGKMRYRKYRIPVDAGFIVLTYIPDESIAEDDVKP